MLPFGLLFVFSFHALLRRFAEGVEMPLLAMTVLSPAYLPGQNLMLDIPALALTLFALVIFFRACDHGSGPWALLAGLSAGLAMETKYTAFVAPAVMVVYALVFGKMRLGVLALLVAVSIFAAVEVSIAHGYGESHFLHSLLERSGSPSKRIINLALPLPGMLGGLVPALGVLGLTFLGASRRTVLVAGGVVGLGYLLVACVPEAYAVFTRDSQTGQPRVVLNNVIFGSFGFALCGITVACAWRLFRVATVERASASGEQCRRQDWFLMMWLIMEVSGYYLLSPFPAARRLMGVIAAATIFAGRVGWRTGHVPPRLVHGIAGCSMALGLGFFAIDLQDARVEKKAAENAVQHLRRLDCRATAWYCGKFGFGYYAKHAGMRPVPGQDVRGEQSPRPGDWVVIGDPRHLPWPGPKERLEPVLEVQLTDRIPLRMVPCYYGGRTALEHQEGARYSFTINRFR
jgi:4-amino-4-deoxy-L-arabinose transferase-like glycosyltransferase